VFPSTSERLFVFIQCKFHKCFSGVPEFFVSERQCLKKYIENAETCRISYFECNEWF